MKLPRRQFLYLAAGAAALPAMSRAATAQAYPTRPITIVVPAAAGGPLDVLARILSKPMRISLGQPLIIENVAGAAGSIGVGRVARAAGDGYMLVLGMWGTHVANAAIYALSYDVVKDFEPVALIGTMPELIVAKKTMPANDLKGLIAWLRANSDKASQGTSGVGSAGHIAGVFFQNVTGTHYQFVRARPGHARPAGGTGRHDDRRADQLAAAGARRQHQGLRGHGQEPVGIGARDPDRG